MRILTDVNINAEVATRLRKEGFKVKRSDIPPLREKSDEKILKYAEKQDFVILTEDQDFLRLRKKQSHKGIMFIPERETPSTTVDKIKKVAQYLSQEDIKNQVIFLSQW